MTLLNGAVERRPENTIGRSSMDSVCQHCGSPWHRPNTHVSVEVCWRCDQMQPTEPLEPDESKKEEKQP